MTLLLKVAIGAFGLLGAIAAIGGDTWVKQPVEWHQRIKGRGWVALTALVLAFLSGTAHELLVHRSSLESEQIEADRHEQLTSLLIEVSRSLALNSPDPSRSTAELASDVERLGFPELAKELFQTNPRVAGWLNVREAPSSQSPVIARIRTGEPFRRLASVPYYHRVETLDGKVGFVSKSWVEPVLP